MTCWYKNFPTNLPAVSPVSYGIDKCIAQFNIILLVKSMYLSTSRILGFVLVEKIAIYFVDNVQV